MQASTRRYGVLLLAVCSCVASLALYSYALYRPALQCDDFQIVVRSWTWREAVSNLWVTANEHAMPLGRLTTWAQIQLAGRAVNLPLVLVLQGPLAIVAGMGLTYLFVRRELGHPFFGLVAMSLFGVSTVYEQAVFWFSASYSIFSLDMTLLALLAAQRWRQRERGGYLLLCAFWVALAPAWFAIGILAGPLCVLYLLPQAAWDQAAWRKRGLALVPLLGSVAFLAVSLPFTARRILTLPHYGDHTAVQAFHPWTGLVYSCRSLVDNLFLGAFGVAEVVLPVPVMVCVLVVLAVLAGWWWSLAPDRRLLLLGLGFIFSSYLLQYSARAEWPYDTQMHSWSRYHLFAQLGLTLFLCGGLPCLPSRFLRLDWSGLLSRRQILAVGVLIAVLFGTQLPRGICGAAYWSEPRQMAVLQEIDDMAAFCRRHQINRETVQQLKGDKDVPGCYGRESGWKLLYGCDEPSPISVEEARRLLNSQESGGSAQHPDTAKPHG